MRIFLDTPDTRILKLAVETGLVDGVTTNPTLIAKSRRDMIEVITEICDMVAGPVSAEAVAGDAATLEKEGRKLAKIAPNVTVKLPMTREGLIVCRALSEDGIKTNVTLCFSANQALLAAKAGATFISPFVGRLDDLGFDGMDLIRDIRAVYDNYGFDTEVLAASIRNTIHVRDAALSGADCVTIPPAVFEDMFRHPLTDKGLEMFAQDWASTGQTIL